MRMGQAAVIILAIPMMLVACGQKRTDAGAPSGTTAAVPAVTTTTTTTPPPAAAADTSAAAAATPAPANADAAMEADPGDKPQTGGDRIKPITN